MSDRELNWFEIVALIGIGILLVLFLQGCFFGRADYETWDDFSQEKVRVSVTVWTFGKHFNIDPNGYASDSQSMKLLYPPIMLETE